MIHTITAAMMSVAITQLMTIIAHIVANTWSTDDQRRWMRRDPGAPSRWQAARPCQLVPSIRPASASPAQQVFRISVIAADPDQFSAWSDAEAVFSGVVRVSVVMAPCGLLFLGSVTHKREYDHHCNCTDGQTDQNDLISILHFGCFPRSESTGRARPCGFGV